MLDSFCFQLPNNWRENIEKALGKEQRDTERPSSPTPDTDATIDVADATEMSSQPAENGQREDKALPVVGPKLLYSSLGF
jgi:hypothetical protein